MDVMSGAGQPGEDQVASGGGYDALGDSGCVWYACLALVCGVIAVASVWLLIWLSPR